MIETTLQFSSINDAQSYFLLELPSDLAKEIESQQDDLDWTIRGRDADDAVLCTKDKTYALRSVVVSNALCLMTGPTPLEDGEVVLRETIHEVLEVALCLPKLQRLHELLRGHEYDEGVGQDVSDDEFDDSSRPKKRVRRTYDDVQSELQASDAELDRGLRESRILRLNGNLRPITPAYLHSILEMLLATLTSLSLSHEAASVLDLADTLESDHDIRQDVSVQVMSWFGEFSPNVTSTSAVDSQTQWRMNAGTVVQQIGLGILRPYKDHSHPITVDELLSKWKVAVGDSFEAQVSMSLLRGNYLDHTPSASKKRPTRVSFFPASSLPLTPVQRFADLFLSQPRWHVDDIGPFLNDIAIDNKERDRLLMKYARSMTEKDGSVWYTARGGLVS